jgi:hypothetical protein
MISARSLLLGVVLAACAGTPAVAAADGTFPLDPTPMRDVTITEGQPTTMTVPVTCIHYEQCDWDIEARDGTAYAGSDYDAAAATTVLRMRVLGFDQMVVHLDAPRDGIHEPTETFTLRAVHTAIGAHGRIFRRVDSSTVTIKDADPASPFSPTRDACVPCATVTRVPQTLPGTIPMPQPPEITMAAPAPAIAVLPAAIAP